MCLIDVWKRAHSFNLPYLKILNKCTITWTNHFPYTSHKHHLYASDHQSFDSASLAGKTSATGLVPCSWRGTEHRRSQPQLPLFPASLHRATSLTNVLSPSSAMERNHKTAIMLWANRVGRETYINFGQAVRCQRWPENSVYFIGQKTQSAVGCIVIKSWTGPVCLRMWAQGRHTGTR